MTVIEKIKLLEKKIELSKLELQGDISRAKSEIIKWVVGLLIGQAAVIAALTQLI